MMQERMLGVVLWADESDNKAVVWCEDHGNLAYFNASETSVHDGFELDAGDLIQFEMREDRDVRRVRNPQRLDMGFAPTLADDLLKETKTTEARPATPPKTPSVTHPVVSPVAPMTSVDNVVAFAAAHH